MLKELIFNQSKWFNIPDNVEKMNAGGKSWSAIPSKVLLANGTTVCQLQAGDWGLNASEKDFAVTGDQEATVLGCWSDSRPAQYGIVSGEYYIVICSCYSSMYGDSLSTGICLVKKSDVKKMIWGG